MKRKQSTVILSAAMAAMMLMSGCGKDGGSAQQETATKVVSGIDGKSSSGDDDLQGSGGNRAIPVYR